MLKTALANLRAHKGRLIMSSLAIALGVSFVAGTFVFTDTLKKAFLQSFTTSSTSVDAVVKPTSSSTTADGMTRKADQIPIAVLKTVQGVPGVAAADGKLTGVLAVIGPNGKPLNSGNQPSVAISIPAEPKLASMKVVQGANPAGPGQVVVDKDTAAAKGLHVGTQIRLAGKDGHAQPYTITGIIDLGHAAGQYDGAAVVGLPSAQAIPVLQAGGFDQISVLAADGVSQARLRGDIAAAVGAHYKVVTGAAELRDEAQQASGGFDIFTYALLAFAAIAVLVSAFVIYNTFAILIAQRMREMALLRCIGSTRGQIFGSVIAESAVLGLVVSLIGLAFGTALAYGLMALVGSSSSIGIPAPVFEVRTVVVAMGVGVLVTVASALIPARRATRIAPMAALRSQEGQIGFRAGVVRLIVTGAFGLGGAAMVGLGIPDGTGRGLILVMAGGVLFFGAVVAAGPLFVPPLAQFIGVLPTKIFGVPGRLAGQNARRNPARTAATTIALTLGLALITMVSTVVTTTKTSVTHSIDTTFAVDFLVTPVASDGTVPAGAINELRGEHEIAAVAPQREAMAKVGSGSVDVEGVDPAALSRVAPNVVTAGSLAALTHGTIALDSDLAKRLKVKIGQPVAVRLGHGVTGNRTVVALLSPNTVGPAAIPAGDFTAAYPHTGVTQVPLKKAPGATTASAQAAIDSVIADYPRIRSESLSQVKDQLTSTLNTLLTLILALLGMSVLIAFFGVANTLSLSVVERTRESALLRAIGLTKRELRRMLSVEAAIMGVVGAAVGIAVGLAFAFCVSKAVGGQAMGVFDVPVGQIVLFAVAAALLSMVAAVLPARRAARTSIVRALAAE
jgi:putative ABC transport system permease protein